MQKITPFLWFNGQAEEAARFYVSVFKNSRMGDILRWGDVGPGPKGSVLLVSFQLEGQDFSAMNGGPEQTITPAISLYVDCKSQQEVDELWEKLSAGGKTLACGWLTDKFGVSWQIIPSELPRMLQDKDPRKADNVMKAMMGMVKIDIEGLRRAYGKQ